MAARGGKWVTKTAALCKKPKKVLLAIGGSVTVDGGVGEAMVFDWKFLDKNNQPI